MLAGNWPHWNPQDITNHPDELLRARLSCADSKKSLVEQDLVELAEGLEGRSTNPVSLLVRSLTLSHLDNFIAYIHVTQSKNERETNGIIFMHLFLPYCS